MAYSKSISKDSPALIIIAIDQSGSMNEAFTNFSMIVSKAEIATMVASALIDELIYRCANNGEIEHLFDIAVLGYSRLDVYPLIGSSIHPQPITALNDMHPEVEQRVIERKTDDDHLCLTVESYNRWIEPVAVGVTPLPEMADTVEKIVSSWCNAKQHRDSFPPIIFNITNRMDRADCTADIIEKCNRIKSIATSDGDALLFNICIDDTPKQSRISYPGTEQMDVNHPAHYLAMLSSPLPEFLHPLAAKLNPTATPPYRATCYNRDALDIIPRLKIRWRE